MQLESIGFKVDCLTFSLGGIYLSKCTHVIASFKCHNYTLEGKPKFQT